MKLSNQSMAVLMALLQKCILEETDIVSLLRELDFEEEKGFLFITNPPTSFVVKKEEDNA
jgi:hypothetical protein